MQIYLSRRGDVLDWICAKHYGGAPAAGVVERVLAANRGLAGYGAVLPEGLTITLPTPPAAAATTAAAPLRIWD
ncbi:MAG: tail protein X [Paracraurococcus sp.]